MNELDEAMRLWARATAEISAEESDMFYHVLALALALAREPYAKDAERYRWLRENCIKTVPADRDGPDYKELQFHGAIQKDWRFALDHMSLDAAVDAALANEPPKEQAE